MGHKPRSLVTSKSLWSGYATMEAKTFALANQLAEELVKSAIVCIVGAFVSDLEAELRERLSSVDSDDADSAVGLISGEFRMHLTARLESAGWQVPSLLQHEHGRALRSIIAAEEQSNRPDLAARRALVSAADETIGDWSTEHAEAESEKLFASLETALRHPKPAT